MKDFVVSVLFVVGLNINVYSDDSPLTAVHNFYLIDQESTPLRKEYIKEIEKGLYSIEFEQKIRKKLLELYAGCLTGEALENFQENVESNFCFSCGDLSFYAIAPAEIVSEEIIKSDKQKASVKIKFASKNKNEAIFFVKKTENGWRINKILGECILYGD